APEVHLDPIVGVDETCWPTVVERWRKVARNSPEGNHCFSSYVVLQRPSAHGDAQVPTDSGLAQPNPVPGRRLVLFRNASPSRRRSLRLCPRIGALSSGRRRPGTRSPVAPRSRPDVPTATRKV